MYTSGYVAKGLIDYWLPSVQLFVIAVLEILRRGVGNNLTSSESQTQRNRVDYDEPLHVINYIGH